MTSSDRPNVLLVVLDSVRAANTSLHGHEHETTPFLEELAEEATVYEQARSPGTWSLPSHTSIFTGYHVVEHGVTRARHELEPGHTIFEELAEDHDYATGVFSENTWITDMPVGLKDAFDTIEGARNLPFPDAVDPSNFVLSEGQGHYVEYLKHCLSREDTLKSLANGVFTKLAWDYPQLLPDRFQSSTPARVYGDLFLDWEAEQSGPWAACVNFMDGHLPYLPDEEYDEWGGTKLRKLQDEMDDQVWEFNGGQRAWWQRKALEGLYDGTIRQMDAQLRRIVETLDDRGELENTLLVVTADHGEGFGEPSRIRPDARVAAHGAGIHEALQHVPLVVKRPGQSEGAVVEEPASLTEFPRVVRAAREGGSWSPRTGSRSRWRSARSGTRTTSTGSTATRGRCWSARTDAPGSTSRGATSGAGSTSPTRRRPGGRQTPTTASSTTGSRRSATGASARSARGRRTSTPPPRSA